MKGEWIGLGLAWTMLNAFAWAIGGPGYTAWSIRVRNEMLYALLRRPVNRRRADDAEEIAEGVARWLRPLLLVAVNAAWLALVASRWSAIRPG